MLYKHLQYLLLSRSIRQVRTGVPLSSKVKGYGRTSLPAWRGRTRTRPEQARPHAMETKTDEAICASPVFLQGVACLSIYECRMRPDQGTQHGSQQILPSGLDSITHGHCPQGNSVRALLGSDVLPVLSTALTTNVFSHSGRA